MSTKHIVELGINRKIGNGIDTSFWLDKWCGECPLYCTYPQLFQIATNPTISVSMAITPTTISIQFTRQLTGALLTDWQHLLSSLSYSSIFINPTNPDQIVWNWHHSGQFIVHSLYKWLEFGGIKNFTYTTL